MALSWESHAIHSHKVRIMPMYSNITCLFSIMSPVRTEIAIIDSPMFVEPLCNIGVTWHLMLLYMHESHAKKKAYKYQSNLSLWFSLTFISSLSSWLTSVVSVSKVALPYPDLKHLAAAKCRLWPTFCKNYSRDCHETGYRHDDSWCTQKNHNIRFHS